MIKINRFFYILSLGLATTMGASCASDDDDTPDDVETGTGGSAGADDEGEGGEPDSGAGGSTATPSCDLSVEGTADLDREAIPLTIDEDMTLSRDRGWTLSDVAYVTSGTVLTIEPCTKIEGSERGTLVIQRGAQIDADGSAEEPIVFTSAADETRRGAGDWGGLVLLGRAPNFKGEDVAIEGLAATTDSMYGGDDPDDSSGVLRHVLIEFGGIELATDNEINGLTMGSVGSGTVIENVMVNTTLDDCFEWFGGTVNAKNLVANNCGDDMFDADQGYRGTLTNLFGRHVEPRSDNPNGFEMDSDVDGDEPVSNVTVNNATMCGTGEIGASVAYGMVLREGLTGDFEQVVVTGFDFGVDLRDASTDVSIADSIMFDGVVEDVGNPDDADAELGTGTDPIDEDDWFATADGNTTAAPSFDVGDCTANSGPNSAVTDSGVGAFAEDADWLNGAWINWATN